ncbi:MAG TPA: hypothetical protein VFA43_18665 [Gemmatimonadaceae bacterium]|nr:hypothetical protein [Gemmatimonadaceae bacterium]
MRNDGKSQLLITFVVSSENVDEVDRLVASHAAWMARTHHREGDKALLSYTFSKGPELANPLDPGSNETGNTRYVLNEIYESPEGIADHWQQAQASWDDFPSLVEVVSRSSPQSLHAGTVASSLW